MTNFPLNTIFLESVDSTNSYLKDMISKGTLTHGTSVMALHQTNGRGRLGRGWLSDKGDSLTMSIAVKNEYHDGFTLLIALAVHETLKPFVKEKELMIKWPNDIICENKKLCGILCERLGEYTVIGIGINVNNLQFHQNISHKATSLRILSGQFIDVNSVFDSVNSACERVLTKYDFSFTGEAKELYKTVCASIGKTVITTEATGNAVDISQSGALIIKTSDSLISVFSGEATVQGIY